MKKILLFMMLFCSVAFGAPEPKVTVGAIYAAGLFNGVYQVVGEPVTVRIYYDTQDLYVGINQKVMAGPKVEHINASENKLMFSHLLQGGRAVNTFERMSDGVLWTMEDGSQVGLVPERALNMQDTMDLMCKTKTGSDLASFKKAALESTGSKCSN